MDIGLTKTTSGNIPFKTIVAFPSDEHCGSTVGLFPPVSWKMPDGSLYSQNEYQAISWEQWLESWYLVRELREGARLIVVHNGDAVEGIHHHSTQVVSPRPDVHSRIHILAMRIGLEIAGFNPDEGDLLYYVGGTPSHVGEAAMSEEGIARAMGAIPFAEGTPELQYMDGQYIWWRLKLMINDNLIDIAHQGPTPGGRAWLKGNILRYTLKSIYYDCLENDLPIPNHYVRSHRHQWIEPEIWSGEKGKITGYLTPCFQFGTEFVRKVLSHVQFQNIGMLILEIDERGRADFHCPRLRVSPDKIQVV